MFFKKFLFIFCLLSAGTALTAAEKSSENDNKLKSLLSRFPEADINKDGILTASEAQQLKKKKNTAAARTVSGNNIPPGKEQKGYNGLFMGHSFFKPAAETLMTLIPDTNVVNHTEFIIMSGGPGGSPEMLWENEGKRKAGMNYLDSGKVEFFAMTYFNEINSSVEDYSKWFDYAIAKNPNINFMIALPWGTHLYQTPESQINDAEKYYQAIHDKLIVALREKYPKNKIIYCPYGLGVYELIRRLNKGSLPGVKHILSPDRSRQRVDQILVDLLGHGTELVSLLSSLIWMQTIYNYDLSTINKKFRAKGLPDIDLNEIAAGIYKKIQPYNALYK